MVAQVELAYWDLALSRRRTEIVEESLRLAKRQLEETRERIVAGRLAETHLAAARAEVASRKEALISAKGERETTRIKLLRLLNPPGRDARSPAFWSRQVDLLDLPEIPEVKLADVESHVNTAMASRSDMKQAELLLKRGELEVVRTKNGLLPKLDLFVSLGRTGYAESFSDAVGDLFESNDFKVGLSFEYVLANRSARARHRRAIVSKEEAALSIGNLAQLVQVDVRSAHVIADAARERINASAATRELKAEVLRSETELFRVGRSTSFQVAQAQRDFVSSQISEIEAVVHYLRALVELYRLDGSLLTRRGITTP
jgi:outer membrane protein TolC